MKNLYQSIDKQIEFNKGKNLFLDKREKSLEFIKDTILSFKEIDNINEKQEESLIDYAANKALEEFYRINQYYYFDEEAKSELKSIYAELIVMAKSRLLKPEKIAENHYNNLEKWLLKNNSFAKEVYKNRSEQLEAVVCSQYSYQLQLEILNLDFRDIKEPILDIGCGQNARLINYLRSLKYDAFGIDRSEFDKPYLLNADWLKYDYGTYKWGTIVSNLGFSNHFVHNHLRNDSKAEDYAKTYMRILNSLKIGGSFHYAPGLEFIENYLDKNNFRLNKINLSNSTISTSIVERIR